MGRRKKNFEKKYDFDDFCITTSIYKKQVVFFQMSFFAIKEDSTILDLTEAKREIKKALRNSFKDIKAERRIYDILMGEISKGKHMSVKLFGGFRINKTQETEIIENEILEHSKELMEEIKIILNKINFKKFTKPQRYERRV